MLSLSCISLPFLSRKGRRECRLVSPASLIFMLAFSHPHLINSGTRLAVSPHLVSLSSLPSGGFGNAMGFCHALEAGGVFFKSNAEQKPQRHSFESQSRWTGEGFRFAEKDKAQLNRADPHNSRVITALCTFSDCSRPQQTQFRIHFKEQCVPRFQMCDT